MSSIKYTSGNYHRKAKKIKNLIRRYDEFAILEACTSYIYAPAKEELDHLKRHPWVVLLLVKWCFIEKGRIEYRKDHLDDKKFYSLLNGTYQLSKHVRMPTEYSHHTLFFRNMSYQQFVYQQPFSLSKYGRQVNWFSSLPTNHALRKRFKEITDVDCDDFLKLSFLLASGFHNMKRHTVDVNWFSPLFPIFGKRIIENFLDSLSVEIQRIPSELKKVNKSKGGYEEYYEQTPFISFPFIKHGDKFTCVHPHVLYRRLEYFIYDILREDDSEGMMTSFSKIFEKYLAKGLEYANQRFNSENDLRSLIPREIKCVDYLVSESAANIFIDAKAVEMHYLGKISGNPEIILGKIKNTVLSGIIQANRLNEYLYHHSSGDIPEFRERSYLIVCNL